MIIYQRENVFKCHDCCSQVSKLSDKRVRGKGELRTQRSTTSAYDVFLGGSCNPTTWRKDTAIPHLKGRGITFYNPQQANWVPEMIELEHQVKYFFNNEVATKLLQRFNISSGDLNSVINLLRVSYTTANIYGKSRNLPNTDVRNYSIDLR